MSGFTARIKELGWVRVLSVLAGSIAVVAVSAAVSGAAGSTPITVYSQKSGYMRVVTPTSPQRPDDAPINLGASSADDFWPTTITFVPQNFVTVYPYNYYMDIAALDWGITIDSNGFDSTIWSTLYPSGLAVAHLPTGDVKATVVEGRTAVFNITGTEVLPGTTFPLEYWVDWNGVREHRIIPVSVVAYVPEPMP